MVSRYQNCWRVVVGLFENNILLKQIKNNKSVKQEVAESASSNIFKIPNILFRSLKEGMNYPRRIHMKTRARKSARLVFKLMDCPAALIFMAGGWLT